MAAELISEAEAQGLLGRRRVAAGFRLTPREHLELRAFAWARDTTPSALIRQALRREGVPLMPD